MGASSHAPERTLYRHTTGGLATGVRWALPYHVVWVKRLAVVCQTAAEPGTARPSRSRIPSRTGALWPPSACGCEEQAAKAVYRIARSDRPSQIAGPSRDSSQPTFPIYPCPATIARVQRVFCESEVRFQASFHLRCSFCCFVLPPSKPTRKALFRLSPIESPRFRALDIKGSLYSCGQQRLFYPQI